MRGHSNQETLETQYLLGKLTEEEKSHFEERYFADNSSFEELEIAETELLDAYVRGELSPADRQRFEQRLHTSPGLVERVKFARILDQSVSSGSLAQPAGSGVVPASPERKLGWWKAVSDGSFLRRPAFGFAVAACAVLVLVGGAFVFVEWLRLKEQSRSLAIERDAIQQQRQELERQSAELRPSKERLAELQKLRELDQGLIVEPKQTQPQNVRSQPPATSALASILLVPGSTRGTGGGNELIVSPGVSNIRLELGLEAADYPSYRAVIKNAQGVEILQQNGLRPRRSRAGRIISLRAPAMRLRSGDYIIRISGITSSAVVEGVHDYALRVRRKQE